MNVIEELEKRGCIQAMTHEELKNHANQPITVYCGFDPTADSLHLGNLAGLIALGWFQKLGHQVVAVVGGATGMIGDPSGKSAERNLLDKSSLELNLKGITKNVESVLLPLGGTKKPLILNNYDWISTFSFIDFLRDVGRFFRVGQMIAKDSVKTRMESEEGLSFTEFSYQVLQGYDFLYLLENHQTTLQIGGSDQWGNITAGVELIRKVKGKPSFGLTFPLITKKDGQKFGKSEKGAIWLSKEKCSPYDFYQHLYRVDDEEVVNLLKRLTYLEIEEIHALEKGLQENTLPPNTLQKKLAEEVTKIVHGEEGLKIAYEATKRASPGAKTVLTTENLEILKKEIPSKAFLEKELEGKKLIDLLVEALFIPSKGEARRLIKNGGLYLNNEPLSDENYFLKEEDWIEKKFILIASGKKNKIVLERT